MKEEVEIKDTLHHLRIYIYIYIYSNVENPAAVYVKTYNNVLQPNDSTEGDT
jgi:hypothetical protein